jgi:3-deoxy-D-manno-octulosonic-acid transferase
MYLLYDLAWMLGLLVLVPWYVLRRLCGGKNRQGLRERFGLFAPGRLEVLRGRKVLWLHAVSVGETRAAVPLIRALKDAFPEHALVLSNVTETGHAIALGLREVDLCLFFPFDLSWAVRRALAGIRPDILVIVETEIWPNLARGAQRAGVPLVLVNGRISDRSFPRYRRGRFFLRPALERFGALCMQSAQDRERILALGAPPKHVFVTGNLKFDMPCDGVGDMDGLELRDAYRLPRDSRVWVAGSTHPGEEEQVLDSFGRLLAEGRSLCLVLAPRHPERAVAVGQLLTDRGLSWVARSALETRRRPLQAGEVLLVDSVGELLRLYAASDLVFVGGSLVPIGGHNVLEAAMVSKPVLFGPHMENFRDIAQLVAQAGAGRRCADGRQLTEALRALLDDDRGRRAMGQAGRALLRQHAGAAARTAAIVRQVREG